MLGFQTEINDQMSSFSGQMAAVIKSFNRKLNASLKFTTEAGVILPIEQNFEQVTIMASELITALQESGYYDLAKKFVENNDDFTRLQIKDMAKRFKKAEIYYGKISGTTLNSLKTMQYNGMADLGTSRLSAIKQTVYQSVLAGTSNDVLLNNLTKHLDQLSQYAETYMRTAKREYSQQTENLIAKEAGLTDIIWEYIGAPLQDNSHEECIWALEDKPHAPFFTTEEKDEFEAGGGYDHTEPRWNCQHIFGITDMTYEEYEGA